MTYKEADEQTTAVNQRLINQYASNHELSIEKELLDSGFNLYYVNGLGRVRLDSYLPIDIEDSLNCLLMFVDKGIENCWFTFSEEDIYRIFFSGNKKGICEEQKYIVYIQNNDVCIQFPRLRFIVQIETARQLSLLFDDLYMEFNRQRTKLINTIDASDFIEESKGKFKLVEMPIGIWNLLKKFSLEHDYLTGSTNWDMFSPSGGEDRIYVYKNHNLEFQADVLVVLEAKYMNNDTVVILWNRGFWGATNDKMNNFDNRIKWTVRYTHDWLLYEWIPYVLFLHDQENMRRLSMKYFFKKSNFEEYKRDFKLSSFNIISLSE